MTEQEVGRTIPSRNTDPATSHAAGGVQPNNQRTRLLRGFARVTDATDEEAMLKADGVSPESEYAKRCSELREAGYIVVTGDERRGASGNLRMVSQITQRGIDLLNTGQEAAAPKPPDSELMVTITREEYDRLLMAAGVSEVTNMLGGQIVSDSETPDLPPTQEPVEESLGSVAGEAVTPHSAAHRVICSQRAQTQVARRLDRQWRASYFGYTAENFHGDYPNLNPQEALESFFSYYIAGGQSSKNWLERFYAWCANGERFVRERQAGKTDTDSMGLPLDPGARLGQRRAEQEHYREQEEFFQQQQREQP